ncbi:MAG: ankyrin repeat and protein kinase domain-containing protein [Candidatus Babeliales bacterium]
MNTYSKLLLIGLFIPSVLAMAPQSPKPLKRPIYTIEPSDKIQFAKETGHFKVDDKEGNSRSVKLFLEHAAQKGEAPESLKKIAKARSMLDVAKTAHWANEQLFMVTSENGNQYILKEIKYTMKPKEEIARLERAYNSLRLEPYIHPEKKNNLSLILARTYLKYNDGKRDHYLVLMSKAKGNSLQSVMEQVKSQSSQAAMDLASQAYYDLGAAMARFYKQYGALNKTVIHKDLHAGNIFYDPKSRLVTLIDNEGFARSLEEPRSISEDLSKLFVLSPRIMERGNPDFFQGNKELLKRWYAVALTSFIFGFIRTYDKSEQLAIFMQLKNELMQRIGLDDNATKFANQTGIFTIIEKEILPQLEQKLIKEKKTPLHIAAGNCDLTQLVAIFINEKTKTINQPDAYGNMPLHEAAYYGCLRAAELLLKAGATVNAPNVNKETPLFKARYNKQKSLEDFLKSQGAK